MRAPVLSVFLILMLAGCAQPNIAPPPDGAPDGAPSLALASVVTIVDPTNGQGEPSLGIAPDGGYYTNQGGSVWHSDDGGLTWKDLGDPTAPAPNFDADLVVDKDGTIWVDTLYVGCSTTATSRDEGKTWTVSNAGCVPPAGDRQYIVAAQKGTAYIYSHHVPTFYQTVAKTTDYGATWTPSGIAEGPLAIAQGQSGWGGGGFWNEKTNSVYLTFSFINNVIDAQVGSATANFRPAAAITRDEGKTWAMTQAPTNGGTAVGLSLVVGAADDAGNAYLSWAEAKGDDMAVYLSVSRDDGKTWSQAITVDDDAGSKVFPAIAAGADGRVAVAYYHSDAHGYPARVPENAKWNVTLAWTTNALSEKVSWQRGNLSTHTLRTGPICPDGTLCDANRELLDYFALKTTSDGRVASVWTSTDDVPGKTVNVFAVTKEALLR